jgi:DNA replication protein DnaC
MVDGVVLVTTIVGVTLALLDWLLDKRYKDALKRRFEDAWLVLETALKKLDGFEAILDDLGYVQQSREEMEVLFTFFAERYERRSVLISSNLVFSQWDKIFQDPMTTMAAIDRLVHHSIILEFDGNSHRAKSHKAQRNKAITVGVN